MLNEEYEGYTGAPRGIPRTCEGNFGKYFFIWWISRIFVLTIKPIRIMATSSFKSPNGTSFHGHTFSSSVEGIKKILGSPRHIDNSGRDKVNFEWVCETKSGHVFTIYSWKEYRKLKETELIEWHIGGRNGSVTEEAQREILEMLD
jgi:hypothetical protein